MRTIFSFLLITSLLISFSNVFAKEEYRGFWVDAFNEGFKTPAQIKKLVSDTRDANCNVLYVEVRKAADAYYNSKFEPKAEDFDHSFDPLKELINQCHDTSGGKSFIEVHAWIVTYRCYIKGMKVPTGVPTHISIAHPEWIAQDINGNNSFEDRQYLDQGVPGVIDHTVNVVMDIVKNYDVDGIHFDYIRYAELTNKSGHNIWGYNPITVARFNKLYKKTGTPDPADPDWTAFRHRQISDLLRKVYANVREVKPKVIVSAATTNWGGVSSGFKNSDPYKRTLQDWVSWMENGLLDMNCIMNYKRANEKKASSDFKDWTNLIVSSKNGRFAINGLGTYMNTLDGSLKQIDYSKSVDGLDGIIFFSYAAKTSDGKNIDSIVKALKEGPFKSKADIPEAKWLTKPQTGIIKGTIKIGSIPADGAALYTDKGHELRTDGTGFYAFLNLEPGIYKIELAFSDKKIDLGKVTVEKGKVITVDHTVKE